MNITNLIVACALMMVSMHAPALVVTPSGDPVALVSEVVGTGTTVVGGTETFIGSPIAAGTFTGGLASGLGFDAGIILTSGTATDAVGPNSETGKTTVLGVPGDAELDTLVPGFTTFDATVVSFDFMTATGDLFFDFIFASEEYNEFIDGGVSDAFGLFVDGTNVAIAPNGAPISIDTVNCGDPFDALHPDDNCGVFNNNDTGVFDLEYDGFTDVLTAAITGLSTGDVHTLAFKIADTGDAALDSAVFIRADSVATAPPPPTTPPGTPTAAEPSTLALLGLGLLALGYRQRRR